MPPETLGRIELVLLFQVRAESILWNVLCSIQLSDLGKLSHYLVCGWSVTDLFEHRIDLFSEEGVDSVSTTWMEVNVVGYVIDVALEDDKELLGSFFLLLEVVFPELPFIFECDVVTNDVWLRLDCFN